MGLIHRLRKSDSTKSDSILNLRFPEKLWTLVHSTCHDSVKWTYDGKGILINPAVFKKQCLREDIFKAKLFSSILNCFSEYGFKKTVQEPWIVLQHSHFLRNRPELLERVVRKRTKRLGGTTVRQKKLKISDSNKTINDVPDGEHLSHNPEFSNIRRLSHEIGDDADLKGTGTSLPEKRQNILQADSTKLLSQDSPNSILNHQSINSAVASAPGPVPLVTVQNKTVQESQDGGILPQTRIGIKKKQNKRKNVDSSCGSKNAHKSVSKLKRPRWSKRFKRSKGFIEHDLKMVSSRPELPGDAVQANEMMSSCIFPARRKIDLRCKRKSVRRRKEYTAQEATTTTQKELGNKFHVSEQRVQRSYEEAPFFFQLETGERKFFQGFSLHTNGTLAIQQESASSSEGNYFNVFELSSNNPTTEFEACTTSTGHGSSNFISVATKCKRYKEQMLSPDTGDVVEGTCQAKGFEMSTFLREVKEEDKREELITKSPYLEYRISHATPRTINKLNEKGLYFTQPVHNMVLSSSPQCPVKSEPETPATSVSCRSHAPFPIRNSPCATAVRGDVTPRESTSCSIETSTVRISKSHQLGKAQEHSKILSKSKKNFHNLLLNYKKAAKETVRIESELSAEYLNRGCCSPKLPSVRDPTNLKQALSARPLIPARRGGKRSASNAGAFDSDEDDYGVYSHRRSAYLNGDEDNWLYYT